MNHSASERLSLWNTERWPSGLRRTPGKRVSRKGSRVRIPVSPQDLKVLFIVNRTVIKGKYLIRVLVQ